MCVFLFFFAIIIVIITYSIRYSLVPIAVSPLIPSHPKYLKMRLFVFFHIFLFLCFCVPQQTFENIFDICVVLFSFFFAVFSIHHRFVSIHLVGNGEMACVVCYILHACVIWILFFSWCVVWLLFILYFFFSTYFC